MEYSLIILLLPLFMFLLLGLCGHKMSHRTAGLLGTTGLFIVTALAYGRFSVFYFTTCGRSVSDIDTFQYRVVAFYRTFAYQFGNIA